MKRSTFAPALLAAIVLGAGGTVCRAVEPHLVKDINPSTMEESSNPQRFVGLDGWTVFSAEDPTHGRELWASDGTAEGTHLIQEFCPGPCGTQLGSVGVAGGRWFFYALPNLPAVGSVPAEVPGRGLWSTDGTRRGTHFIGNLAQISSLGYVDSSGVFFFTAADAEHGREPWRSDGTSGGTWRLADVAPGPADSIGSGCFGSAVSGGYLLFAAATPGEGCELWRSDGSSQGTTLVRDIRPGDQGSYPLALVKVGDEVVFEAYDDVHGNELWRSDGTRSGTELVTEIASGADSTIIGGATNLDLRTAGDRAYFLAATRTAGEPSTGFSLPYYELWQTDGTKAGTRQLTHFDSPTAFAHDVFDYDLPYYLDLRLAVVGSKVYFSADDGQVGWEPWVSDGTALGTHRLADLCAGTCSSEPVNFEEIGDEGFVFEARDEAHGGEIWLSDGTAAGTEIMADLCSEDCQTVLFGSAPLGDRLVLALGYLGNGGLPFQMWVTGGTPATTRKLGEWSYSGLAPPSSSVGGQVLFAVDDGIHGPELWATAGTPGSTRMLDNLVGQVGSGSFPVGFTPHGSRLFFGAASAEAGRQIWSTDGTTAGTRPVGGRSSIDLLNDDLHPVADLIYYWLPGLPYELWRTDGTEAGTFEVFETRDLRGRYVGELNGEAIFSTRNRLWKTDGTAAGTGLVTDAGPTEVTSSFVPFGNELFFLGSTLPSTFGTELWKTDGTKAGTRVISQSLVLATSEAPMALGDLLYFPARDGQSGSEIWATDGTEAGTHQVTDLVPHGGGQAISLLARLGGRLLFEARTPDEGWALWTTDGTVGDQELVFRLSSSLNEYPGKERTVGRSRGRDVLYFQWDDGVHGLELWSTDGTPAGTGLVKDVFPGSAASTPLGFVAAGGTLVFSAVDPSQGRQLWRSDGTTAGTYAITSVASALTYRSNPNAPGIGVLGDRILFAATDAEHGDELWSLPLDAGPAASPDDPGAGGDPPPPVGEWFETPGVVGFRFKLRIAQGGGSSIPGAAESSCIPETLCVSGAVPGRSEVFVRVVGPKPNGKLWPTLVKFTTSQVEVWIQQLSSGQVRYYRLEGASPGVDELPGLFDRDGFDP